ncbi:MAG TPA: hypothetical protein VN325_15510 [Steroidobacteraceae bacterium]|nr:hypothetical protein [Steroidobacteraceae bacterium]
MSRSLHTDPRVIRAIRRILDPRAPRADSHRRGGRGGESVDRFGVGPSSAESQPPAAPLRIRVTEAAARPGWLHAASRRDVLRFLRLLDPDLLYGVRQIALAQAPAEAGGTGLLFGRFVSIGRIELFEQPVPPWFVRGRLPTAETRRLLHAGASVRADNALGTTWIDWQPAALRKFFLREVLMHELGHHRLQHDKGKRPTRIARTRDHEAYATRIARRHGAVQVSDGVDW